MRYTAHFGVQCTAALVNVACLDLCLQAEEDPGMPKTLTTEPDSAAVKLQFVTDTQTKYQP